MWSKIKAIASTALVFIAGILGFIGGIFFYGKYMDKPETQVVNDNDTSIDIGKVKSKEGNVSVTLPVPEHTEPVITASYPKKKFFDFLKKKPSLSNQGLNN